MQQLHDRFDLGWSQLLLVDQRLIEFLVLASLTANAVPDDQDSVFPDIPRGRIDQGIRETSEIISGSQQGDGDPPVLWSLRLEELAYRFRDRLLFGQVAKTRQP